AQSMDAAVRLLRRAPGGDPADFWGNHDLGFMLGNAKPPRGAGAARYRTAAGTLRPRSPRVPPHLGEALRHDRQYDEAIACFRQALTLAPRYANTHINLGIALAAKGEVDEAIASIRNALEIDPKHAGAYNNLGNALSARGEVDGAIACYRN